MAIDSEAKRKSVLAISSYFMGPVVVPDGSISTFDRQVIGYGYGGIESQEATVAGFIFVSEVSERAPYATVVTRRPYATVTERP